MFVHQYANVQTSLISLVSNRLLSKMAAELFLSSITTYRGPATLSGNVRLIPPVYACVSDARGQAYRSANVMNAMTI